MQVFLGTQETACFCHHYKPILEKKFEVGFWILLVLYGKYVHKLWKECWNKVEKQFISL